MRVRWRTVAAPPSLCRLELLQKIHSRGMTKVIIEHDMHVVFSLSTRISVMAQGAVIEEGTPEQPMDKDTRRAQLRRLRASYQSSTSALRRTPLYIPRSSFVSQREIRRLPTFVCYNDIVASEGASEGAGLGHRFLGHVERCSTILHLVDACGENPLKNYKPIE